MNFWRLNPLEIEQSLVRNVQSSEFAFINKSRDYRLRYTLKSSSRLFVITNVAKQRPQGDKSCCSSFLMGFEKRKNCHHQNTLSVHAISKRLQITHTIFISYFQQASWKFYLCTTNFTEQAILQENNISALILIICTAYIRIISLNSTTFSNYSDSDNPGHKLLGHLPICALKPTISTTTLTF